MMRYKPDYITVSKSLAFLNAEARVAVICVGGGRRGLAPRCALQLGLGNSGSVVSIELHSRGCSPQDANSGT